MNLTEPKQHTRQINAEGKVFGRLAAEVAFHLQGKSRPQYTPNILRGDIVRVKNVHRLRIDLKKKSAETYYRHSGYPGGIKRFSFETLFQKNPEEHFRRAVWNMLPKNKLRSRMIRRLHFIHDTTPNT